MNFKQTIAILLCAFFAGLLFGYILRGSPEPEIIEQKVRRYVPDLNLPELQGPSLDFTRQYRFIHTSKIDTVIKEVPVPVSYGDDFYLTRPRPISRRGNTIQFRYYDPVAGEEGLDEYTFTPRTLSYGLYADAFWPVDHLFLRDFRPMAGVRFTAEAWRVQAHLGTYYSVYDNDFAAMAGVSVRLFGK